VPAQAAQPVLLQFDDNSLLPLLYGEHDQHLTRLEAQLGVRLAARGNRIAISGPPDAVRAASLALKALYERLRKQLEVSDAEVDAAVRMAVQAPGAAADEGAAEAAIADIHAGDLDIITRKRRLSPRSPNQAAYMRALRSHELVFAIGPAGTGKTYLAVAMAVSLMMEGRVDRIILSRPAVEAGERLGFLPGDLAQKIDPYLRPLYDALYEMLGFERVHKLIERNVIEVAPLAYMRGRTLNEAFIILDEAQNTTTEQMKMFLTRIGFNSKAVINGDITQVDLPQGRMSGLKEAQQVLAGIAGIEFFYFDQRDVVRHPLVQKIVSAYDRFDRAQEERQTAAAP
jgi:phosphate starvation-inducible PhoH-like protein